VDTSLGTMAAEIFPDCSHKVKKEKKKDTSFNFVNVLSLLSRHHKEYCAFVCIMIDFNQYSLQNNIQLTKGLHLSKN